ncbi:GTPase Era [Marinigracilibium pacificum]|uniref:GTPase Era n=1 Tax=Marinigracilibium pacificum TaxID=2729599 RepID=A0A848J5R6_9BACT|nr:GTPase Era [Marinigracilibium pacificum]NMM49709.1 GTPase Era [Marinigracilibium pacificum]
MSKINHKAGFVNIIGKPNVGKSTLMNALIGQKLSIITSKAQTTRHRIMGLLNGDDFQVVFSDTPGILKPQYELHKSMMGFVQTALEDADILLYVTDPFETLEDAENIIEKINRSEVPTFVVINKTDLKKDEKVAEQLEYLQENLKADKFFTVSALNGNNVELLFDAIMELLPEHPAYFPKDEMSDKPERFFVEEIVREKIFLNYKKEVPYSSEVVCTAFEEDEEIIRIYIEIYVERKSQRAIIIGHNGASIKKVGIEAREDMEKFFGKQVYLESYVRVEPDWRKKQNKLNKFGYNNQ